MGEGWGALGVHVAPHPHPQPAGTRAMPVYVVI